MHPTIAVQANEERRNTSRCENVAKKYAFNIDAYAIGDIDREEAEHFIQEGFKRAYNATVSVTMPWILAINNGAFKAALGIRPATDTLFLEQYLDNPVEQYLASTRQIQRSHIAEIGHLYSNSNKFTLPLFLTTAVSLFTNEYKYMVFSATEHVLQLISRAGIPHTFLSNADPARLNTASDNWGSYYDTKPKVVAVSLLDVMAVVNNHPLYARMFEQLSSKIAATSKRLQRGGVK
ncbi:thermostable hemolysin [Alteromonas facilis]|uniref:thermostable hemolysin n=1 Tax=Alteromonas facilis TaxID=2048004 RepID=UPI000C2872A6|nr:thermostable hemolysin [Alteromonas facilis]